VAPRILILRRTDLPFSLENEPRWILAVFCVIKSLHLPRLPKQRPLLDWSTALSSPGVEDCVAGHGPAAAGAVPIEEPVR
jgi:hypothetical protein